MHKLPQRTHIGRNLKPVDSIPKAFAITTAECLKTLASWARQTLPKLELGELNPHRHDKS